jgi:hydroxyacylglutathione hydrolase
MHAALSYLGSLPDATLVYTGHEYTADNLAFARAVDPNNKALDDLKALIDEEKITQGRSSLKNEKEWNVFMRLDSDAVRYVQFSILCLPCICLVSFQKSN